jgi:hypothetical protein
MLFWAIIALILGFQFQPWFNTGAIAFAISYSFIASIHAIIIGVQSSSVYDADLFALELVLQSSIFAALLCIQFSYRLFNRREAKLFVWWCLAVFVARSILSTFGSDTMMSIWEVVVPLECDSIASCDDICAYLDVKTTFRGSSDSMQAVLWEPGTFDDLTGSTVRDEWVNRIPKKSDAGYDWLNNLWNFYFLLGPLLMCAVFNSTLRPREARNHIFRRLRMGYVRRDRNASLWKRFLICSWIWARYFYLLLIVLSVEIHVLSLLVQIALWIVEKILGRRLTSFGDVTILVEKPTKLRYVFAKTMAVAWYFTAIISYFAFVAGAIFLTAKAEKSMRWIPESESPRNVGQWSTWMALGLAGCVAIIMRLRSKNEQGQRKMIMLQKRQAEDVELGRITAMEEQLAGGNWRLPQYLVALLRYESLNFMYWWKNTIDASKHAKVQEKGFRPKQEKAPDEKEIWEEFSASNNYSRTFLSTPDSLASLLSSSSGQVEYSYEDDKELQASFFKDKDIKTRLNRSRKKDGEENSEMLVRKNSM